MQMGEAAGGAADATAPPPPAPLSSGEAPTATAAAAAAATSSAADGLTAGTAAAVLDKLATLDLVRKAERDRKREEQQDRNDPRESIAAFLQQFSSRQGTAEAELEQVFPSTAGAAAGAAAAGASASTPVDPAEATRRLDKIAADIFDLAKGLADASYFLPSYDQRQCNAAVAALRARVDAARAALVPRRKFAFSGKVARVTAQQAVASAGVEQSPPAPATAPADAAATTAGPSGTGTDHRPQTSCSDTSIGHQGVAGTHPAQTPAAAASAAAAAPAVAPSQQDIALVRAGSGLMGLRNRTVVLTAADIGGQDFVLIDLSGCDVFLLGCLPALRILGVTDCRIFTGPVTGATFVDVAVGCTLVLATYQARIHRAHGTDFYLRVRSNPIIEHSSGLRFAPYCLKDPGVEALLSSHLLGDETGLYRQVDDFGWIKATQSPNWEVLPEAQRIAPVAPPPPTTPATSQAPSTGAGAATAPAASPPQALPDEDEI